MQNRFRIKNEFIDCDIHTKDSNGNDIRVDKHIFNDTFANMILAAGQGHLIERNPMYDDVLHTQKKTFEQVSEGVIVLTLDPLKTDLKPQEETQKQRKPRSDAGKLRKQSK
jgi:hypothetical protein